MNLEDAARYWRERLIEGKPIYRVRVRRLLELAGAERRGLAIMDRIRGTLDEKGLETDPDFQSAWIDGLVRVKLKGHASSSPEGGSEAEISPISSSENPESPVLGDPQADPCADGEYSGSGSSETAPVAEALNSPAGNVGLVETSTAPPLDPVARILSIPAANRGVVSVLLTDPITTATTRMIFEGYSQLAIMQDEREVRGMISWASIAKRSLLGTPPQTVAACREDAQVIDAGGSLFDALPTIEKHGYVLVRSKERKITGIVTATDLSAELGRLSYAFMSLRTIELLIRSKLHPHLTAGDLTNLEEQSRARQTANKAYLTFGENIGLLERPEIWSRLSVNLDKKQFIKRLLEVRNIRNEVMHFDPDPLSSAELRSLQQMEEFLHQVFS